MPGGYTPAALKNGAFVRVADGDRKLSEYEVQSNRSPSSWGLLLPETRHNSMSDEVASPDPVRSRRAELCTPISAVTRASA